MAAVETKPLGGAPGQVRPAPSDNFSAPPERDGFRKKLDLFLASKFGRYLKWCVMVTVLLWLLLYRFSEANQQIPNFVYVNF